ncbi:MAG: FtsX-like permease family protein [Bacteroidota bacterium]
MLQLYQYRDRIAAKRLKEIGVRKTIGATRRVVVVQFLTENIVVTSFALVLGIFFGMMVFIPGFESANEFSMDFLSRTGTSGSIFPASCSLRQQHRACIPRFIFQDLKLSKY